MKTMVKKIFDLKALDIDTSKRKVKIAIAETDSVDRDEEIIHTTAADKTIKESGPQGINEVWHLLDHTPKSFSALSKFSELYREGDKIIGVSNYKNSFAWREVAWPLYEAGDITQHSIGFEVLKDEYNSKGIRVLKEIRLYEGSAVLWGANINTPTMQVVKSIMNIEDDKDITAAERIDEIVRKMKKGRTGYNEDDISLIIIELKRIQTLFGENRVAEIFKQPEQKTAADDKATEPETKATLPEPGLSPTIKCPSCNKPTHNDMTKGYIRCINCKAAFVRGSKNFIINS